jgi:hypothetical protein
MDNGLNLLYPTPVYKTHMTQSQCDELLNWYLCNADRVHDDNHDDYELVRNNIFINGDEEISNFKTVVNEKFSEFFKIALNDDINKYTTNYIGWFVRTIDSGFMAPHNHSGAHFVSVFYIYSDEMCGGDIVLQDPRVNANRGYLPKHLEGFQDIRYSPKTGDVLIFPAYLYHYVKPNTCKMRIAVPVDLYVADHDKFNFLMKAHTQGI